jgi:peroxiredoxin
MTGLVGTQFPDIILPMTTGSLDRIQRDRTVMFFYPYTGRPGHADPEAWDDIPGAHGSTPQALAFSALHLEFEKRDTRVFGVSFQTTEWQQEFVNRHKLNFALLSDAARKLSSALSIQTFKAGGNDYLVRRTIVVQNGRITHDIFPILHPEQNADDCLQLLRS